MSDDPSMFRLWAVCPECGGCARQGYLFAGQVGPWERSARAAGLLVLSGQPEDEHDSCSCHSQVARTLRAAASEAEHDPDEALRLVRLAEAQLVSLARR